jgi:hypothetical protein
MYSNGRPIKVIVCFEKGFFFPVRFVLNEKSVRIHKIVYVWKEYRGDYLVYRFSVRTSRDIHVLEYKEFDKQWYYHESQYW